jgi:hypothetical protein
MLKIIQACEIDELYNKLVEEFEVFDVYSKSTNDHAVFHRILLFALQIDLFNWLPGSRVE